MRQLPADLPPGLVSLLVPVLDGEVDTLVLDDERLKAMSEASRALARPDAAEMIARQVMEAAR